MEEKREPLSEMAIERKIQILRNKHMDSEVIALVKSDYEYGLTDDEIGLYLNKSYDIEQMKVLSKCLHKGVSEELLTLLKDSRMAAPKMQTALDYYEKGVPIDAIREVVQKDDTAVNMRRMFDVVLEKLNKAKEQMPQDLEYVKSLVAQMDEVVAKINHQNERYDALNKKLSEIETSKDDEEVDCQHFFRQIFLGYFSDIVQAFDTLRKNVCGDDYTSLHNPIVLSSVLPAYGMFHSIQILFL